MKYVARECLKLRGFFDRSDRAVVSARNNGNAEASDNEIRYDKAANTRPYYKAQNGVAVC